MTTSRIFVVFSVLFICSALAFYLRPQDKTYSTESIKIHGFNLVAPRSTFSPDSLLKVKATGAEWVALVPYGFCNPATAEVSFNHERQWWGERPEGIKEAVLMAQAIGLKVMIKPHLWVGGQGWAGDLDFHKESMWQQFEKDYEDYLMTFVKLADSLNVEMLCIGTEIRQSTAKRPDFWLRLIKQVKSEYNGLLTYAANWDEYNKVSFWNELDYIGIDAYFPLNTTSNPELNELVENWAKPIAEMERVSMKFDKPILFTEYGYESIDYSTAGHWNIYKDTLEINFEAQNIAFSALYASLNHKEWWKGGFIWKWHLTKNGQSNRTIKAYTPQDKPAMESISKYFNSK